MDIHTYVSIMYSVCTYMYLMNTFWPYIYIYHTYVCTYITHLGRGLREGVVWVSGVAWRWRWHGLGLAWRWQWFGLGWVRLGWVSGILHIIHTQYVLVHVHTLDNHVQKKYTGYWFGWKDRGWGGGGWEL